MTRVITLCTLTVVRIISEREDRKINKRYRQTDEWTKAILSFWNPSVAHSNSIYNLRGEIFGFWKILFWSRGEMGHGIEKKPE